MEWPVLCRYEGRRRRAISLPVGGIGTGSVGFGGRGQLRDWELENHPSKGLRAAGTFLACRVADGASAPDAFLLEGELFPEEVEGALGSPAPLSGLKRFDDCSFETTYPFGRARLRDERAPVAATVAAWNPLVPGDVDASSWPIAVFDVTIQSLVSCDLDVTVLLSVEDLVGHRLRTPGLSSGASQPRIVSRSGEGLVGALLGDDGMDRDDEEAGTIAAAALGSASFVGPQWALGRWNQGLTAMWEGLLETGIPASGLFRPAVGEPLSVCLGVRAPLAPLATSSARFLLSWHFPNRRGWQFTGPGPRGGPTADVVGNHYCTLFADAWSVAEQAVPQLDRLETETKSFLHAMCTSDLAPECTEAALFNLSTLRTQTFFRTADGYPFGWEGTLDDAGSCPGSCTHVWNYELATPFAFPTLARKMREVEYLHATSEVGAMSFRVGLPLGTNARQWPLAAADGQFGCLIKLYREWRLSGDAVLLRRCWPAARRSLEFAWLEGSWDGDADGVAEGCLHNTMDVEYFGPTAIIQSWYLGALLATAEMAGAVGDDDFAERCRRLHDQGRRWTEANLFNGSYYVQQVRPPRDFASLRPEVRHPTMGAQETTDPEFQIGDGCLVDQLAGDVGAIVAGLGSSFDADHVRRALLAVHELNAVSGLGWWKNYMRTFATRAERGHIMLAYPNGLPAHPMPYWSEVMTGFEYTYALGLVYAGMAEFGRQVVAMIRDRYDGELRNPFDEAECGHHYARAMASWGLLHATAGVDYDGRDATLRLTSDGPAGRWVFALDGAWGVLVRSASAVEIEVRHGALRLDRLVVGGRTVPLERGGVLEGTSARARLV
jgi:non-lysosomal glucosylceramidase